jgi:uncharacterized membrane protein
MLIIILLLAQLAVLALAAYAGRVKLKKLIAEAQSGAMPELGDVAADDLHEVDRAILKLLTERQGVLYQSEIMKELGLPKSTVHKSLRRLSEAGYVEIQKRGRFNVVILRKLTSEASPPVVGHEPTPTD